MNGGMILAETGRSFLRRLGTNILLMCQFVICFFLLITMMTYYLSIGESSEFGTICKVNDRKWYELRLKTGLNLDELSELAMAHNGLERASSLYKALQEADSFDVISAKDWQGIYLETELMEERFGLGNYNQLIDNGDGNIELSQCYHELPQGDQTYSVVILKSVQMNWGAFQTFGLGTVEGEGFTQENTTLNTTDDPLPVVLGNDYQGHISVGEEFLLWIPTIETEDWLFRGIVVGILEDGSIMPTYGGGEGVPESERMVDLDRVILVANGVTYQTLPEDPAQKTKITAEVYSDALDAAYLSPREGYSYQTVVKEVNDISREHEIEMLFTSVSFGMELLLEESKTMMALLLILTGAMAAFTVFCLVSTCISRVRDNMAVYAVRLLNGAGLGSILAPCLLEFAILLLPALSVNYLMLRKNMAMTRNYVPMLVVLAMAAGVFCLAACITVRKIGGINIEEQMRRMDA